MDLRRAACSGNGFRSRPMFCGRLNSPPGSLRSRPPRGNSRLGAARRRPDLAIHFGCAPCAGAPSSEGAPLHEAPAPGLRTSRAAGTLGMAARSAGTHPKCIRCGDSRHHEHETCCKARGPDPFGSGPPWIRETLEARRLARRITSFKRIRWTFHALHAGRQADGKLDAPCARNPLHTGSGVHRAVGVGTVHGWTSMLIRRWVVG